MVQIQVTCSNECFSGIASMYLNHDGLLQLVNCLEGFPSHPDDVRDCELGTFDPKSADGGIRLHLYCRDSSGHAAVDGQLRGNSCAGLGEPESVALGIPIEAAAIDSFLLQLRKMDTNEIGASASLEMAR